MGLESNLQGCELTRLGGANCSVKQILNENHRQDSALGVELFLIEIITWATKPKQTRHCI